MNKQNLDLSHFRKDFPMLSKTMHGKPLIYLDTAATSQKPQVVIDAVRDYYENHYGTVHRSVYELSLHATKEYQNTRLKLQHLLNAAYSEEIIFTKGTTESINLVAYSFGKWGLQPGDEILISAIEHHSNIVPWQMACEERGAVLKAIPVDDRGVLDLNAFKQLLNSKTKLVAIAHISNTLGTLHPIREVIAMAHQAGAKVLIDGAQAISHVPVDVQALDVDFYAFSGHKCYGPTGVGVLYGKKELLEAMPPYQGGGDMIETVTLEKSTYNSLPLRFEAGTPMIAEVLGLGAAVDYLKMVGLEAIQQWEHELLEYATEMLKRIPKLKMIGTAPQKGAIISFQVAGAHSLDIGTLLDLRGVAIRTGHLCSQPTMARFNVTQLCRASFAFYNTKEEIDQFAEHLQYVLKKLEG